MEGSEQIQSQTARSFPNKISSKPDREGAICTCTNTGTDTKDPSKWLLWPFPGDSTRVGNQGFPPRWLVNLLLHGGALDLQGKCRQWTFLPKEGNCEPGETHQTVPFRPLLFAKRLSSGPLCRQNTFCPNMHNHQEKKAGRPLHRCALNEGSPPHSIGWMQGIIPSSKLGFLSSREL